MNFIRLSENIVNFPQMKEFHIQPVLFFLTDAFKVSPITAFKKNKNRITYRGSAALELMILPLQVSWRSNTKGMNAEQNFSRLSTQDLVSVCNPQRFGVGRNARRSWTIVRCSLLPSVWAHSVASAVGGEYIRPLQVMWPILAAAGY